MNNQYNSRFSDASWFDLASKQKAVIGGVGGIGSWLALFLSRIGVRLFVYDMDEFEQHNLGGQFANKDDIGKKKTVAIRQHIAKFSPGIEVSTFDKYKINGMSSLFMFSAFDNMEARKFMFDSWFKNSVFDKSLFIDGRLTMEQMQIFCVKPKDVDKYREFLFDDSEVEDTACTMKQTSHSAAMIASFMTGFFTNHLANLTQNNEARSVPFEFEYFIPLNLFKDA